MGKLPEAVNTFEMIVVVGVSGFVFREVDVDSVFRELMLTLHSTRLY
jgi:hypothetical protein